MTDFYKKIYGYEDDIQLKDNDINILEKGMNLFKMSQSKKDFNKRFYRLDLNNNQLVASTKEFRKKQKSYSILTLNEVKSGCCSDNLKSYQLNKLREKKRDEIDIENLAFCITYDNFRKSIDLLAPNEQEQLRWVRVLNYFILLTKKRKGIPPETDIIMRNYFELADIGKDKAIDKTEMNKFLNSININVKKGQLDSLMLKCDSNNDGVLTQEEFTNFMLKLYKRQELLKIFKIFADEYMTAEKFKVFVNGYQIENVSQADCQNLIKKYEIEDETKSKGNLSFGGFVNYLMDHTQFIENHENEHKETNMDLPIFSYFVNSSHNTYLSGDQITSKSSADCYKTAIMNGARLVEMDVYNGDSTNNNQPCIYHQKTFTTKILFEEAIVTCKQYAFKLSEYPLIITIELHCSKEQQLLVANIIKKHLYDYLYTNDFDCKEAYPTLNQLKNKILIRCRNPSKVSGQESVSEDRNSQENQSLKMNSLETNQNIYMDNEYEESAKEFEQIKELSDLLNIMQNVSFKGVDYNFENYQQNQTCSLSEAAAAKLIENETSQNIIKLTQNYLFKIYPGWHRQDSSNLSVIDYWIYGFQIVALNFQTHDESMQLNTALFCDNKKTGYVLKPNILLDNSCRFDPNDLDTMRNKQIFEIRIISGQHFPVLRDILKDISDPYVTISVIGIKADMCEQKTQSVSDNGFNPIWDEKFIFVINCPELAFIKFTVKDKDVGKDQLIGEFTIRFENIRQGFRHIKLINKQSKGTLFVAIRIKPLEQFKR